MSKLPPGDSVICITTAMFVTKGESYARDPDYPIKQLTKWLLSSHLQAYV